MQMQQAHPSHVQGLRRRDLLKAGLAVGVTLSAWPLQHPPALWGAEAGPPRRGGILRVRGWDPVHFDPHLTITPDMHRVRNRPMPTAFCWSPWTGWRGWTAIR